MWGQSRFIMSNLEWREDILMISMYPASSSTLIHEVWWSRVRLQRKLIGSISYSAAHYTLDILSIVLCLTRERISATSRYVSNHKVDRIVVRPSTTTFFITQSTYHEPLLADSSWDDLDMDRQ